MGSFFYTMIVFIFVSTDITFTELDIQIWFALSISLVTICELTNAKFGVNPALSFAYQFWFCLYEGKFVLLQYSWSTILGPLIGGFLGGIFFEFVYRPIGKFYKDELM